MTSQQAGRFRFRLDLLIRFLDQATVSGGNLLMGVLLARALGPANFGIFATLWTITLFGISSHWALITSPMQTMPPSLERELRSKMFPALLTCALGIGITGAFATMLTIVSFIGTIPSLEEVLAITIALVGVLAQEFARRWLLVTERPRHALLSDAIRSIGTCVALYFITALGECSIPEAFIVIAIFAFVACLPIAKDLTSACFGIDATLNYVKKHWEVGRWLMPYALVQWAIAAAPIYALSIFVGSTAAGGYRVAVYLISPIIILTDAFETFLPLRATEAFRKGGTVALNNILLRYTYPMLAMSVTYCILVSIFSESLLGKLFGADFKSFHFIVILLACSGPIQNLGYIKNVQLRAVSAPRGILVSEVISGGMLIMLYAALPLGGLGQGAAAFAIASQVTKYLLLSWYSRRVLSLLIL
jgi:O-antigen/teichoic acid export membrane protein